MYKLIVFLILVYFASNALAEADCVTGFESGYNIIILTSYYNSALVKYSCNNKIGRKGDIEVCRSCSRGLSALGIVLIVLFVFISLLISYAYYRHKNKKKEQENNIHLNTIRPQPLPTPVRNTPVRNIPVRNTTPTPTPTPTPPTTTQQNLTVEELAQREINEPPRHVVIELENAVDIDN